MTVSGAWRRAARGAGLLNDAGEVAGTIFGEMSALAQATGAINLGQGFPDEDGPALVLEAARRAIAEGHNQYPPARGTAQLRQAIAEHQSRFYGLTADPDTEVLVTAGATEALAATLLALLDPGDEVVVFEPYYDAYAAVVALAGGVLVPVPLQRPAFQPDLDALRDAVSERTRVILVNDPHNPTGSVFDAATRALVVELADRWDAVIVTDEVYEHLVFGDAHVPLATLPGARERTVSISSAGKTFSTTGWKIGWICAPTELITAIIAVKQFLTYVNGSPFQGAIAQGLALPDSFYRSIAEELRGKRDLLVGGLHRAGLAVSVPQGTYFVVADATPLGGADAAAFCRRLPELAGVVGVPISAFVSREHQDDYAGLVRFAFCKRREVLEEAAVRLAALGRG